MREQKQHILEKMMREQRTALLKTLCGILFLGLLFVAPSAWAAQYYVSTSGNDANPGTSTSQPWRTLTHAAKQALNPGDVINLRKGDIFYMSTALAITKGGANGQYVTWNGAPEGWGTGSKAIIRSTNHRTWGNVSIVNIVACKYLRFQNVIIDGANYNLWGLVIGGDRGGSGITQNFEDHIIIDGVDIKNIGADDYSIGLLVRSWYTPMSNIQVLNTSIDGTADHGIAIYPGRSDLGGVKPENTEIRNVTIRNCFITNYHRRGHVGTGDGILLNNKLRNVLIEHCTITRGLKGNGVSGIMIVSNEPQLGYFPQGVVIRNNIIKDIRDFGIWFQRAQATTADIYNNLIINSGSSDTQWGGGARVVNGDYKGAVISFYNNTFYNNGEKGGGNLHYGNITGSPKINFRNNIVYTTNAFAINDRTGGLLTHSHNNLFRSGGGTVVSDGGSSYSASNLTSWESTVKTGNPRFLNTSNLPTRMIPNVGPDQNGLHIQNDSPARDSGTSISSLFTFSINHVTRPAGNGWDMGAYEIGTSASTQISPPNGLQVVGSN